MGKKAISLLLIALMMVSMLTGCGANELGYLNLSKEINNITEFKFTNKTQVEVSGTVVSGAVEGSGSGDYNLTLDFVGQANVEDLNSIYLDVDVMVKVNDMGNELPIKLIIADNKVYVSKNAIVEAMNIGEKLNSTIENQKVLDELVNVELKDIEYLMLSDMSEYYNGVEYKSSAEDLYENAYNYLVSAFKGFDSKLVAKTNNGFKIELTPEATFDFIERLVIYISDNKEMVFDETVKYIENIYDDIAISEMEGVQDKQAVIDEIEASRQDFYDFMDEMLLVVKSEEFKAYEAMFDRSYINDEISKKGSSYVQNVEGELVFEDVIVGNFGSKSEITPTEVTKTTFTGKSISAEDLEKLQTKVENRINPVNKIELSWYPNDYSASIYKYRLDGQSDWDYQDFALIEERVYLPLRYIGESFGEEVAWDNDAKKAYVIRGNERIDMTGVLVNNKTMVKIRDFEKLGYKIGYNQVDGYSTATIEK